MGEVTSYTKDGIDDLTGPAVVNGELSGDMIVLTRNDATQIAIALPQSSADNIEDADVLMRVVVHGEDDSVPRPAGGASIVVHWIGTAEPENALDNDLWTPA